MAEILLKAGADPLIDLGKDRHVHDDCIGRRPWYPASKYAFASGDRRMAAVFLPYVKSAREASRALGWAVDGTTRSPGVVVEVLSHPELDVNAKDGPGRHRHSCPVTPLYLVCAARDAALIRLLLAAGADPNVPHDEETAGTAQVDGDGCNALQALASRSGFSYYETTPQVSEEETKECFRMVIAAGANRMWFLVLLPPLPPLPPTPNLLFQQVHVSISAIARREPLLSRRIALDLSRERAGLENMCSAAGGRQEDNPSPCSPRQDRRTLPHRGRSRYQRRKREWRDAITSDSRCRDLRGSPRLV